MVSRAAHYAISKNGVILQKKIHISAGTRHRILNFASNLFKYIAILLACRIYKLSNLNIHELQ